MISRTLLIQFWNLLLKVNYMLNLENPIMKKTLLCGLEIAVYELKQPHSKKLDRCVFVNGIFSHLCRSTNLKLTNGEEISEVDWWIIETERAMNPKLEFPNTPTLSEGEDFYVPIDGVWEEISFHHPKDGEHDFVNNCPSDPKKAYVIKVGYAITSAYYRQKGRKYLNLGVPLKTDVGMYKVVRHGEWISLINLENGKTSNGNDWNEAPKLFTEENVLTVNSRFGKRVISGLW